MILKLVAVFIVSSVSVSSYAQPVTTKSECNRLCNDFTGSTPKNDAFERKLAIIRDKKKDETDPDKLKSLKEDEQDLVERHKDDVAKMCRTICSENPNN